MHHLVLIGSRACSAGRSCSTMLACRLPKAACVGSRGPAPLPPLPTLGRTPAGRPAGGARGRARSACGRRTPRCPRSGTGPSGRPFRGAQHQQSVGLQGVVEQGQHVLLDVALQVDQHVAADDQVQVREGRVAQQVVRGEDDQLAHLLAHPVGPPSCVKNRRRRSADTRRRSPRGRARRGRGSGRGCAGRWRRPGPGGALVAARPPPSAAWRWSRLPRPWSSPPTRPAGGISAFFCRRRGRG